MAQKSKATKKPAAAGGTKKTVTAKSTTPTKSKPKTTKATTSSPGPSTKQLKIGQKAPAFSLPNQDGKIMRLADFKGRKVVLYFYPKDDTPGCTKESCAFRDGLDEIHASGAVVLGISGDSVDSHKKFVKKFNLNFPLLSDETKTVLQAYGVWKEKSLYGRNFMGVERTTFIIDEQGKLDDIFPKVKVDGHLEEVLAELDVMP